MLIRLELWRDSLLEGGGEGSNGVIVRPALRAGEHREVDLILEVVVCLFALLPDAANAFAVEDHRAARSSERLVGGGGHDVAVVEG